MLDVPKRPSATRAIDLPLPERTQTGAPLDVRWSDDGSRILVARSVDARAWPLLDAARPDIGALLAIGGLVLLAAGIGRVIRRPRVPGRSYCRRCNHDLNAVPGARPASDRCPECGLSLGARAIVRGSTRARRLARVLVPSLAAMGLGAWLFTGSVRGAPLIGVAWPIAAAAQVPGWPWARTSTVDQPSRHVCRVDVIRVEPEALVLESPCITDDPRSNVLARPDGTVIAWVQHSPESGWVPTVRWFDVTTGRGGSVGIAPAHAGFPSVCGWSPDGREIIAVLQRTGMNYRTRDDGTAIIAVDVMAVDPETGAVRTVDRGRGRATGGPPGGWALGPAIAAVGTDPQARTVTLATEQVGQGNGTSRGGVALRELTVDGRAERIVTLDGTIVEDVWGVRRAWIEPGGRLGVEFASAFTNANPARQGGPRRLIDLETGAVTEPPEKPGTTGKISPDGSRQFRIEVDRSTGPGISRIRVLVDRISR